MAGRLSRACAGTLLVSALGFAPTVASQSTDGYHTIQIIPVVVDTASFTQRFHFRKHLPHTTLIVPTYFPVTGTSQSGPLVCPTFEIPTVEGHVASLRELCPGLPAGPQFGYVSLTSAGPDSRPFAAFSRVSNATGIGFAVEAFPAHSFTGGFSAVSGIRRLAAAGGAPAYQTNCFIARLNELEPVGSSATMRVFYGVGGSEPGTQIGTTNFLELERGQIVRLLDVFAAVGAPAGDFNDANFRFGPALTPGSATGALMGFCTVQDNTSFGADFRISKTEYGTCSGEACTWDNPVDEHVNRVSDSSKDIANRPFSIPAGTGQNSHVYYFRHPDWIQCELTDIALFQRLPTNYGLEMRLVSEAGVVLAGGNNVVGFNRFYLGDKGGGANTRYVIQVESSESNEGVARPYRIHCESGSGHTPGEVVRFNEPVDQF